MRRFFSFLLGTIMGALVGAAVALLIAPSSGDELKARAKERITGIRDEIQEAYQERVSQLEAELENMRKKPDMEIES